MAAVTGYSAICDREDNWWVITVPELDSGGVTKAKRLDQVTETVRSLVHLMTGEWPDDIALQVHVPEGLGDKVERAIALRERAEADARESGAISREAARVLAASGLPLRDIGVILGVSYQRAHQLLQRDA